MFGSLGVPELLLIFAVVLIVFGPRRIPEVGRMLGKALGEFRKATDDLKNTIEREVRLEELKKIPTPSLESFMTPFESVSRTEPAIATETSDAAVATAPASTVETAETAEAAAALPEANATSGETNPA
jgi:TatA/E family protein of Tat protein translocase